MKTRINIEKVEPAGYKAVLGLEKFIESTPLTRKHKDLIKIRSSQINGCAFCIDMHTKDARALGESEQRLYALNAWRETLARGVEFMRICQGESAVKASRSAGV